MSLSRSNHQRLSQCYCCGPVTSCPSSNLVWLLNVEPGQAVCFITHTACTVLWLTNERSFSKMSVHSKFSKVGKKSLPWLTLRFFCEIIGRRDCTTLTWYALALLRRPCLRALRGANITGWVIEAERSKASTCLRRTVFSISYASCHVAAHVVFQGERYIHF
jgi:hypothetical protein